MSSKSIALQSMGRAAPRLEKFLSMEYVWGVTLEPEFTSGKLIPAGIYRARLYNSPKFGRKVILLSNVPGFDAIEIHVGNDVGDTEGCILVGSRHGNEVWQSGAKLDEILAKLRAPNLQVIVR